MGNCSTLVEKESTSKGEAGEDERYEPLTVETRPHYDSPVVVTNEKDACIISWMVTTRSHQAEATFVAQDQLLALHREVLSCSELVDAVILEDSATSGLVFCRPLRPLEMNKEDVAVRFGQLLCRWACLQQPPLKLNVGVHVGGLTSFNLPSSGRLAYTGEAVHGARHLAHNSGQEMMVHLSKEVRSRLGKLASLQMMVSPKRDSFYLDNDTTISNTESRYFHGTTSTNEKRRWHVSSMWEELKGDNGHNTVLDDDSTKKKASVLLESTPPVLNEGNGTKMTMTFEEFQSMLTEHGVSLSSFGKDHAMTLQELYSEIIVEKDSHLIVTSDGTLKRVKQLVRISLVMRGADNRLRELRIAAQQREGGVLRKRNQKLAVVLKVRAGDTIRESVEACFEDKFNLTLKDQKQCMDVDWDTLSFKEEELVSATVPNMTTIYKTHNLVVNIRDKTNTELNVLGLPNGSDFTTIRDDIEYFWTWSLVGSSKEDDLLDLLQSHGIESSDFTMDAFAELYDEVYETELSSLEVQEGQLVRKIRIVKVWLIADILSVEHVLQVKKKIQKGKSDDKDKGRPLSMRVPKYLEWGKAVENIFMQRLGIEINAQSAINVDPLSYRLSEEVAFSRSFPGLKTVYLIDEVTAHVTDVHSSMLAIIGLPDGHDFAFSRWDSPKGPGESHLVIQHWCWQSLESFRKENRAPRQRTLLDKAHTLAEIPVKRRLSLPGVLQEDAVTSKKCFGSTGTILERMLKGKKTDWMRARKAASRIRDKVYTCREFHEDVTAAFPELALYLDDGELSSGRTGDDEYQRTMGAMFAVFWLMRLHLDGSHCFSYGLGHDWNLRRRPAGLNRDDEQEWDTRQAFHEQADWDALGKLMVNAGLLWEEERQAPQKRVAWLPRGDPSAAHDEERTLAMLVLTAIHDIMKVPRLLPTVTKSAWRGFQVGEVINDHDLALAYVLERQPKVLPSFAGLPKEQQASILFSQNKMEYNMGWMVQAEAPPGALLRKFREVVVAGEAESKDIAFYFVHWFTDLAGAEPCPLEGCEKFTLKFPRKVLNQFLQSFQVMQEISPHRSETEVVESYLEWRWSSHEPSLGRSPIGKASIAKMRCVIMAQGDSQAILKGFEDLTDEDKKTLAEEMSLTGCKGQFFRREPKLEKDKMSGPAFLIYYAPALMQKAGKENPNQALRVMAEVYRQARSLWPLTVEKADETVTVRIDALKVLTMEAIMAHEHETVWVLSKLGGKEASVQLLPVSKVTETDWSSHRVLEFHAERVGAVFSARRTTRVI